ncbi:MAG: hypothetical protein P8N54_08790, partial [Flavobacteriales bacterium]|nr:hypothetical protein [Flavobacteriales bacterium]
YKGISFSGVISDAISLGKKMIVSEDIIRKYSHPLMIPISEFSNPAKQKSKNNIDGGWQDYIKNLKQL